MGLRGPQIEPREVRLRGGFGVVPLTRGFEAIVDLEDVAEVGRWNWFVVPKRDGRLYAARTEHVGSEKNRNVGLARQLLGFPAGYVRFADGDGLNCRRSNLRLARGR